MSLSREITLLGDTVRQLDMVLPDVPKSIEITDDNDLLEYDRHTETLEGIKELLVSIENRLEAIRPYLK